MDDQGNNRRNADKTRNKKTAFVPNIGVKAVESGAEGSRTPVQTYSQKAFYMLIPELFVGK